MRDIWLLTAYMQYIYIYIYDIWLHICSISRNCPSALWAPLENCPFFSALPSPQLDLHSWSGLFALLLEHLRMETWFCIALWAARSSCKQFCHQPGAEGDRKGISKSVYDCICCCSATYGRCLKSWTLSIGRCTFSSALPLIQHNFRARNSPTILGRGAEGPHQWASLAKQPAARNLGSPFVGNLSYWDRTV